MKFNIKKIKKGLYILNISSKKPVNLTTEISRELEKTLENLKQKGAKAALDLRNIENIFDFNFLKIVNFYETEILSDNPNFLVWLSLVNKGVLPPVYLYENNLYERKFPFVKRDFHIV